MLAIVLTFDSFPCAALGCYGNEWIDTPQFDLLAAEGVVFDAHLAHSAVRQDAARELAIFDLADFGSRFHRLIEADAQAPIPAEFIPIDGQRGALVPPRDWPFARLLRGAREWLSANAAVHERQLLWLHSAGIPLPCEVPHDVESLYIDEFADRGIDWSSLSRDEQARHPALQAAYASCLDHFLGELLTDLEPIAAVQPVMIVIVGLHGGSWRTIPRRAALPIELEAQWLRSPAIWWTGPSSHSRAILPGRSPALVQPIDLLPTVLHWFDRPQPVGRPGQSLWPIFESTAERVRDVAMIDGRVLWTEQDVTITTRPQVSADEGDMSLVRRYLWPEDLWQVNDLAALTPELTAERLRRLTEGSSPLS